jgi:hypothetical protein
MGKQLKRMIANSVDALEMEQRVIIEFSAVDVLERNIECFIVEADNPDCDCYYAVFNDVANECKEKADVKGVAIFSLLSRVCSLILSSSDKNEPLVNMWSLEDKRSALVSDFADEEVDVFKVLLLELQNPELKARLADIVWLRTRDRNAAQVAIESYVASSKVERRFYTLSLHRVRRAIQLAKSLKDISTQNIIVSELFEKLSLSDDFLYSDGFHIIVMLDEENIGDFYNLSKLCEKAAHFEQEQGNELAAHSWFLRRANFMSKLGERIQHRESVIAAAECFVRMASIDSSAGLIKSINLEKAIRLYRTVDGTKDKVEQLHHLLNNAESSALSEMKKIELPAIDISSEVLASKASVNGLSFEESITVLATRIGLPSLSQMKDSAVEQLREFSLLNIIPSVTVSEKGRRIAESTSIISGKADSYEQAIYRTVLRNCILHRNYIIATRIDPIREEICLQHSFTAESFLPMLKESPFISSNRIQIYAKGFYLGFTGELFAAAHILVPQIENSIRDLFEQSGVIVNTLTSELIQEEFSLNKLLDHNRAVEILGSEDLVFELRGFLVERQGENYRNCLSHGLLDDRFLNSTHNLYVWWLALMLCFRFEYK